MKKRYLLLFILLLVLFSITGCNKKTNKEEPTKKEETKVVDKTLVKVNDVDLHINSEKEFKGLKYTISEELKEAEFDNYIQYYLYQEQGPNLLFFRIFYYQNKDSEYIRKDLAIDSNLTEEKGKNDNIEYTLIDTKRTDGTIHFYFIKKDNTTYVINFVSQYDISDFEKLVFDSIKL